MNEKGILHQNKVKLMGTILIVLSILSAVFMTGCLIFLGSSYRMHGSETTLREFIDAEIDFDIEIDFDAAEIERETRRLSEQFTELDPEEVAKIVEEAFEETKRELEDPGLLEDLELFNESVKVKQIFIAMIFSTVLTFVISFFLIMIGRSWRRLEPFSRSVIIGLRGLGFTFLAQVVLDFAFAEGSGSITEVVNSYPDYGFTMAPLLSLGILLLSLSWVIEHGQKLNEAEKLTI